MEALKGPEVLDIPLAYGTPPAPTLGVSSSGLRACPCEEAFISGWCLSDTNTQGLQSCHSHGYIAPFCMNRSYRQSYCLQSPGAGASLRDLWCKDTISLGALRLPPRRHCGLHGQLFLPEEMLSLLALSFLLQVRFCCFSPFSKGNRALGWTGKLPHVYRNKNELAGDETEKGKAGGNFPLFLGVARKCFEICSSKMV